MCGIKWVKAQRRAGSELWRLTVVMWVYSEQGSLGVCWFTCSRDMLREDKKCILPIRELNSLWSKCTQTVLWMNVIAATPPLLIVGFAQQDWNWWLMMIMLPLQLCDLSLGLSQDYPLVTHPPPQSPPKKKKTSIKSINEPVSKMAEVNKYGNT